MAEMQRFLNIGENGIETLSDDLSAISETLTTWLSTPEGSRPGYPTWGHPLNALKFENIDVNLAVMAEILLLRKLTQDLPEITVRGITVTEGTIDSARLNIALPVGLLSVPLQGGAI